MGLLEKVRRIFASDANYQKRSKPDMMANAPWIGNYDRSSVPKDMRGGVSEPTEKKRPSR